MQSMRRQHDGGATIALGLQHCREPSTGIGVETLPRLIEDDELKRMASENRPQTQKLSRAARQCPQAPTFSRYVVSRAEAPPVCCSNAARQCGLAREVAGTRPSNRIAWGQPVDANLS